MNKNQHSTIQSIVDRLESSASYLRKRFCWQSGDPVDEWIIQESFYSLYAQVMIALESIGLMESRVMLANEWAKLQPKLTDYNYDPDSGAIESPALWTLQGYIKGIRSAYCAENKSEIDLLDKVLRNMAILIHKLDAKPTCEEDVAKIMNPYLCAVFDDYTTNVSISGIVGNFRPDGGIHHLHTAIEFKYVDSNAELTRAIRGITEDIGGYQGSKDWTQFVAAIYMTHPYESESRIHGDIVRAGGTNWRVILVNGGKDGGGRALSHRAERTTKHQKTSAAALSTGVEPTALTLPVASTDKA